MDDAVVGGVLSVGPTLLDAAEWFTGPVRSAAGAAAC
jgi:hypothetical protein